MPNGSKGSSSASREELGETTTGVDGDGAEFPGTKASLPGSKPCEGSSGPEGGENLKGFPEGVGRVSVMGLKDMSPEYIIAVTICVVYERGVDQGRVSLRNSTSGDARKFIVCELPSLRARKFRL